MFIPDDVQNVLGSKISSDAFQLYCALRTYDGAGDMPDDVQAVLYSKKVSALAFRLYCALRTDWGDGASDRALAPRLNVSRIKVRAARSELAENGFLPLDGGL